jgi:hypothetical protein
VVGITKCREESMEKTPVLRAIVLIGCTILSPMGQAQQVPFITTDEHGNEKFSFQLGDNVYITGRDFAVAAK